MRTAQRSMWPGAVLLFTALTTLALMLSQTHALQGNSVTGIARWLMLGVMCAMLKLRPSKLMKLRRPRVFDGVAAAFICLAFASVLYSAAPSLTIQRALSLVLLYGAVFWTLWFEADLVGGQRISDVLLKLVAIVYVAGIGNLFFTDTSWMKGRFRGILENPNAVGMLTILFLPVAVAYFLRKRSFPSIGLILLMIGSLALSGSRSGVLASCVGLVYLMFRIRAWKTALFLTAIGVMLYLVVPDTEVSLGSSKASTPLSRLVPSAQTATGGGRFEAWQVAIPIIRQNILLGHGFGTEDLIFQGMTFRIHRGLYIHNSYLGATYQLGLVGAFLIFIPLYGLFFRRAFSRQRPHVQVAAYEAALLGGLIASFSESWIYSTGNAFAFPFWVMVMLLVRATLGAPDTPLAPPPRPARRTPGFPYPLLAKAPAPALPRPQVRRFDPPAGARG